MENTSIPSFDGLVLHYGDFTLLADTYTDFISGLVANRCYVDGNGIPKLGFNKPQVQYNGGLYFDGSDILQFPPYDGNSSYFTMNSWQTIIMIIRL